MAIFQIPQVDFWAKFQVKGLYIHLYVAPKHIVVIKKHFNQETTILAFCSLSSVSTSYFFSKVIDYSSMKTTYSVSLNVLTAPTLSWGFLWRDMTSPPPQFLSVSFRKTCFCVYQFKKLLPLNGWRMKLLDGAYLRKWILKRIALWEEFPILNSLTCLPCWE